MWSSHNMDGFGPARGASQTHTQLARCRMQDCDWSVAVVVGRVFCISGSASNRAFIHDISWIQRLSGRFAETSEGVMLTSGVSRI